MKIAYGMLSSWLGVAAMAAALLVTTAGPAHADTGWWPIAGKASNRCLDVRKQDDWYHANARIQLWECSSVAEKQWRSHEYGLEPPSGEFGVRRKLYQIISLRSGMCMQTRSGPTDFSTIDQIPCAADGGSIDAADNQLWQVEFLGTNEPIMHYGLAPWSAVRRGLAKCLDTMSGGTGNGTMIILLPCDQSDSQSFYGSALQPS